MSTAVLPRTPLVLIAIVGSEGDPVAVNQLLFEVDPEEALRVNVRPTLTRSIDLASQVRVEPSRPMIVPLRIELRYNLANVIFRGIATETDVDERIRRTILQMSPGPTLGFGNKYGSVDWMFTRPVADLPEPARSKITPRYIFGRALELTAVRVAEERIQVAQAPAASVITNHLWEEGSCPFASFVDAGGNSLWRGRVLVGAVSSKKERTDTLVIPHGAVRLRIEEIEPEISYISRVAVHGSGGSSSVARNIALRPGDGLELDIPPDAHDVTISGFYELL
jgi:hypothetical protein